MQLRIFLKGVAFLSCILPTMAELELTPVSNDEMDILLGTPMKRAPFNAKHALQLKSEDHVYWAGRSKNKLLYADMTLRFPESHRTFVSMDRFRPLLEDVACNDNVNLKFKDAEGLKEAEAAWKWVNEDKNRHMVMLATWPGCGPPGRRNPYAVSSIKFDKHTHTAHLRSELKEWIEVASSHHMKVSHAPLPETNALAIRDDPDWSFSVASNFNQEFFNHTMGGWYIALACTDCGTQGQFNVDVEYDMHWFSLGSLSASIQPEDVAAFMAVYGSVGIGGVPKVGFAWRENILSIPLSNWSPVPGLIELGPYAAIDVGFRIGQVSGGVEFATGARVDISNDAIAGFGLLNSDANKFSGWEPIVYQAPISLNAHVTAHSEVYIILAAQLRADIRTGLGSNDRLGYIASFDLRLPYVGADITASTTQNGSTCPGVLGKDAISAVANIGVELGFEVGPADDMANQLLSFRLYNTHTPLWSSCWGIGHAAATPFQNITTMPGPTSTLPSQDPTAPPAAKLLDAREALVTEAPVLRQRFVNVKGREVGF